MNSTKHSAFLKARFLILTSVDPDLVRKVYRDYGDARQIFEDARAVGIIC